MTAAFAIGAMDADQAHEALRLLNEVLQTSIDDPTQRGARLEVMLCGQSNLPLQTFLDAVEGINAGPFLLWIKKETYVNVKKSMLTKLTSMLDEATLERQGSGSAMLPRYTTAWNLLTFALYARSTIMGDIKQSDVEGVAVREDGGIVVPCLTWYPCNTSEVPKEVIYSISRNKEESVSNVC